MHITEFCKYILYLHVIYQLLNSTQAKRPLTACGYKLDLHVHFHALLISKTAIMFHLNAHCLQCCHQYFFLLYMKGRKYKLYRSHYILHNKWRSAYRSRPGEMSCKAGSVTASKIGGEIKSMFCRVFTIVYIYIPPRKSPCIRPSSLSRSAITCLSATDSCLKWEMIASSWLAFFE